MRREPDADPLRRGRSHRRPEYRSRCRSGLSETGRVPGARVRARAAPTLRREAPTSHRIGRQQQFMRAVINQMLKPEQIAKAPGLVGPVSRACIETGLPPGDWCISSGRCEVSAPGPSNSARCLGPTRWSGSSAVVQMDPSAEQIFAAIRDGKPITGVGTQLVNTPPSEANTTVAVIDAGRWRGRAGGRGHADERRVQHLARHRVGRTRPRASRAPRSCIAPVTPPTRRREQVLPGAAGGRGQGARGVRGDPRADRLPPGHAGPGDGSGAASECPNPTA